MAFIRKYHNQIASTIQLLICAVAVILTLRKELSGKKKKKKKR